jgi:inosine-uridine nucleoside N-ribohydrolase
MTRRKILIDTDPGIDDAMAIFYALSSPELEVLGLTTVFGNATTPICTQNALRLLEIAGRSDIPVAQGAEKPLVMPFEGAADFVHGADGQGNTHLSAPQTSAIHAHAVEFMYQQIMAQPGDITLVALGPLTNVALALLLHPDITSHLREIIFMGGNAFTPGNATPAAEANIFNDPEAADIVCGATCPVIMVGLDVTEKVLMTDAQLDWIGTVPSAPAQHLAKILPFYRQFHADRFPTMGGIHIHDSTVITYLLAPHLFKTVTYPVRVETGGIGRGKTYAAPKKYDRQNAWTPEYTVHICTEVDAAAAIQLELDHLKNE